MTVTVVKADGSQQSLTDDVLDVLRSQLRGPLVTSGDPGAADEPCDPHNLFQLNNNIVPMP